MSYTLSTPLYHRNPSYLPRVAAVHDLCGYGKCSLGVAIPVLSAAGIDVCPVPTSLFSAHTKFPTFHMHDTTDMLAPYLDAWTKTGIEIDGVYSGFLGAPEQVAAIMRLYEMFPEALRIVDPVMGDGGHIYPTYTPELCDAMKGLVQGADVLLPNLTEAAILTDTDYEGQTISDTAARMLVDKLIAKGAKSVVLKGVIHHDNPQVLHNYVGTADTIEVISEPLVPFMLHGTGDLFASGVCAAIFAGKTLVDAVDFAGSFVRHAMEITQAQPDFELRGVSFEGVLTDVVTLIDA